MTKVPRDMDGRRLSDCLSRLGYTKIRVAGDHWIMQTLEGGLHQVSVPQHKPLKVGIAADLLSDIRKHFGLSLDELLSKLRL